MTLKKCDIDFLRLLFVTVIIVVLFQIINLVQHENLHKQIYDKFEIPSDITYNLGGGYVQPYVNWSDTAMVMRYKEAMNYQIMTEIEAYNTDVVSLSILISAMLIAFSIHIGSRDD